jgi:biofilm PGA synthesis N-glycosyltransferase PgaC
MPGVKACCKGVAVGALGITAAYGHVVYPLYIGLKSRGLRDEVPPVPEVWPSISVVVAAYREAAVIGAKLDQLADCAYPGPMEIIVVADDPATAAAATRPGVRVMSSGQRQGKSAAVNRGVAAATNEIVVLSDANAILSEDAFTAVARHFTDETVGAVAGEKRVDDAAGAQGFYWKFESWLKRCESATGQTIGVVGEMLAFRRDAFVPLPQDVAVDDAWLALDIAEAGLRVVYEPEAYSVEIASADTNDEWERRTRIVAGNLDMLWRRRDALVPGALPVTPQLWGHRLIRSSLGPVAHVALVGLAVPAARESWPARVFLAGNAVGVASMSVVMRGGSAPAPVRLAAQVFFLQAVALGGVRRFLAKDRPAVWPKPERSAPTGKARTAPAALETANGVPPLPEPLAIGSETESVPAASATVNATAGAAGWRRMGPADAL